MKLIAEGAEANTTQKQSFREHSCRNTTQKQSFREHSCRNTTQSKLREPSLLAEGAEAKIYSTRVKGLACVLKDRIKKEYRLEQIDTKLRKLRTRHEVTLLASAARAGVNVPKVVDVAQKENTLCIEEISGPKVRDYLLEYEKDADKVLAVCKLVGKQIAKMHAADITHGDLTTSNMIFTGERVYLIDFGLGQASSRTEDKAVDLHLLKECLKSKHYPCWRVAWDSFRESYESSGVDAVADPSADNSNKVRELYSPSSQSDVNKFTSVFEQLKVVEARGRYRKASSADFASAKYKKLV